MLIAMHILRLFKTKRENNVFEEEKFLEQFDTPQIIFVLSCLSSIQVLEILVEASFFFFFCNCGVTLVFS